MSIGADENSQLAVVHGLVTARAQRCKVGVDIYSKRCSPVSYGILCRERWDENKHQGEDFKVDEFEKEKWAINQISWFLRQVCEPLDGHTSMAR